MALRTKQPASSPREKRGLEVYLWTAMILLLLYGLTHREYKTQEAGARGNDIFHQTTGEGFAATPAQTQTAVNRHREWVPEKSPMEIWLEKTRAALQAEEDPEKREAQLTALMEGIEVKDIRSLLDDLGRYPADDLAVDISQRLLRRWAANDGSAAAAWVAELPVGSMRDAAMSGVAIEWANANLADAAVWAQTLNDATERDAAMLAVANEAVRAEPVESLRLAAALPDTPQRDELLRHAAAEWTTQDPSGAVAWAEQIPDADLRAKVLAGEAVSWAEQNPEAAATLAVEKLPAGRLQEDAVVSIVQRWAQQQPTAAAAWVERFPSDELKLTAIANVTTQWSLFDVQSASDWNAHMMAGL